MRSRTDWCSGGSPLPVEVEELRRTARADAAAGSWSDVRAQLAGQPRARAECPELSVLLAEASLRLGDARGAWVVLTECLPILGRGGHDELLRRAVNLLGAAHFALGEVEEAERAFTRALQLAYAAGDLLLLARLMNNLGAIANLRGAGEEAISYYELALPVYRRLGHTAGLAETYHNLAITFRDLGRLDEAEGHEQRSLELARSAGDPRVEQMARVGLAELKLLRGDARGADEEATQAAVACATTGEDPLGEADALRLAGAARAALGEVEEALVPLDRALELARRHGDRLLEAEALQTRAGVYTALDLAPLSRHDVAEAERILRQLGAA
jgi:tetratricopeptide (TPR) repeat protein